MGQFENRLFLIAMIIMSSQASNSQTDPWPNKKERDYKYVQAKASQQNHLSTL
jgi:hypothetical protein